MLNLRIGSDYKTNIKKVSPRDKKLVNTVVGKLLNGEKLDPKYRDQQLRGKLKGKRDCHIKPDLILIYQIDKDKLILFLIDIGNHSNLQLSSIKRIPNKNVLKEVTQQLLKSEKINDFIEDLYGLRKESIEKDGEYGLGNLVFKEFRNLGYLDNLKELKNQEKSKELSLENLNKE